MRLKWMAVIAAMMMIAAVPALADEVSPADEQPAAYTVKPAKDKVTQEVVEDFTGGGRATAGTWEYNVYVSRKTIGYTDWTYRHRIQWTGNGTSISMYNPDDWSHYITTGFRWSDQTDDTPSSYWSGGKQHKRVETHGKYSYYIGPLYLFENNPYIDTTVRADSGHWINAASIG